jgi:hypothetical protein
MGLYRPVMGVSNDTAFSIMSISVTDESLWQTKKLIPLCRLVLSAVLQKFQAFWEVTLCRLVNTHRRFEVTTIGSD